MKILYAASNNTASKIQLKRFMSAMENKRHIIKIAAYKKSSPKGMNIDWVLDCLLNAFTPDHITLDNDNYDIYYQQIKYFAPDLIISDLEYFTSHIANELNIPVWQCSSSIVNFALNQKYKYNLGVFSKYAHIFNKNPIYTQRIINIIDNSNCNFVYSHFGDTEYPPTLKENFEWIRPYHKLGKKYIPCQHNIVAGLIRNNKNIFDILKKYNDCIVFTEFLDEEYFNINIKDIDNEEEYYCNLNNSNLFINEGNTSFLADAFYNNKFSVVFPNMEDSECLLNSSISEKLKLSISLYQEIDMQQYMGSNIKINYNKNIKYLHEKIDML